MTDDAQSSKTLRNLARDEWRAWLTKNHSKEKEVWLIFYKKHIDKGKMSYLEALDEALCFGWIDGRLKRIDDQKHMIGFSPRRKGSMWSDRNVRRVRKLIEEGKMTMAGLAKIDSRTLNRPMPKHGRPRPRFRISPEMRKRLMSKAWENYCSLAPSSKEMYAYWLTSAKRPETKERRLREAIALLEKNKKLGMT